MRFPWCEWVVRVKAMFGCPPNMRRKPNSLSGLIALRDRERQQMREQRRVSGGHP